MTRTVNRILFLIVCSALLLTSAVPCFAHAQNGDTVTVAYIDYNSFITKAEDGSYTGYAADYLGRISEYTGWKYEFVDMDWPTAFEAVKNGQIDFYCVARQTEDRQADFDFSLYPICDEEMNLYTLPDSNIFYEDFEAFDGMKIGMLKNSGEIDYFKLYAKENGFDYELREYPLNDAAVAALRRGEVDAIALVNYSVSGDFKLVGNFGVSPAYMMSSDGSVYMAELSRAQEHLYFDDPDYMQELERHYYGDALNISDLLLTRDEAEYIENSGELTIALSRDMAPIEYYDGDFGTFHGVTVDLLQRISALTGLKFRYVLRGDAQELRAQMDSGEVTLVGAMARDAGVSEALGLIQTSPFTESTLSLVTKNTAALTPESTVAVPTGYPMFLDIARRSGYGNIREFDTMEACVEAVYTGKAALTYIISICEGYLLDHVQYADLRPIVLQDTNNGICLGVSESEDGQLLLSIINKSISVIPNREINEMIVKNSAEAQPRLTLEDMVIRNRSLLSVIGILLVAAIVLAIIYTLRTRQRRLLDEKRRQHNEFLQHLYDTLPCGVLRYSYEPPYRILSCNAASIKIYGYENDLPVIGKTAQSLVLEGTQEAFREKFLLCEQTAAPIVYTWPITRKDGSTAYTECVMDLVETENGKVFQEVFIDETERVMREKQIEQQYARELNRTGKRAEGLLYTVCVNVTKQELVQSDIDVEGIREGMSVDAFLHTVSPGLSELQSKEWLDEFYDRLSCERSQEKYDSGNYEDSFTVCRRWNGRFQWLRVDMAFRMHPAGDLMCFAYIWDATDERVETDIMKRLAFTNCERFMSVDATTGLCLQYFVGQTDRLTKSEAMYGQSDIICDMVGHMTPEDAQELRRATALPAVAEQLEAAEHYQVYATLTDEQGERQDKALTYFYTDKANGMLAVTVADVTKVRQDEVRHAQLLSDALAAAEMADAAKGQFLSRVSHEMRTPLNAIIGFIELAKGSDAKTMENYRASADIAARQLLSVINDVLDMSSIESGKMKIAHAPFNFRNLIASLTNIYGTQCRQKGVTFETQITTPIGDWLVGDEMRVNQILMNLLGNAVKFTSEGRIRLTVAKTDMSDDTVFIRFEVSDTGCGMSEEMQERLFLPFEQESAATASKYGGSGLGLSIVKSLVGMMGGVVRVESKPNVGTTFTVDLPFTKSDVISNATLHGKVDDLHVLVVDDDEAALAYMRAVLDRMGVRYACVGSGSEALVAMETSERENDLYNVCLIDWRMPTPDGIETTGLIRKRYGEDVVVIVVSAYDFQQAGDSAKEAGANLLLSKPIFQSALFDLFMTLTGGKLAIPDDSAQAWDFSGKRILLAEDNELNQIVAMGYLEKCRLATDLAENGQVAVDKFLASEPGYYDAILMDIQMPILDGFAATKAIRESGHPQAKTIKIIAQTANAFNEDIAKALSLGMNAHVSKPIDPDILYGILAANMGCDKASASTSDGGKTSAPEEDGSQAKPSPEAVKTDKAALAAAGVEYDKGVQRFGGKAHLYQKYLLKFFDSEPLTALQEQLQTGDCEAAFRIAHDLKGSTGNLCLERLHEKICEITELLRGGGQAETINILCAQAAAAYDDAKKAVLDN